MEKKKLIVNTGSDSNKYALYEGEKELTRVHLERGNGAPIAELLKGLISGGHISGAGDIGAVAVRVVAPGDFFTSHRVVDDEYVAKLRDVEAGAPLHLGPVLKEIEEIRRVMPGVKLVGVSDSAFYQTLPEVARNYAIPRGDARDLEIRRYGYHGISVASIIEKVKKQFGTVPGKMIVCHLGSGASVTALLDGQGVDTSMGYTPLEGLVMSSRVGNIDSGAVLALGKKKGLDYDALGKYLNNECGLLALSGKTKEMKDLVDMERAGDTGAKMAIDVFALAVKKYIGAYTAELGGLDMLVFTATIGERSNIVRERVCRGLEALGVVLDMAKNDATIERDGLISDEAKSRAKVVVLLTDEMGEMSRVLTSVGA